MKKRSTSKSAFFNLRVLIASVLCLLGAFVALVASGAFSNLFAQTKGTKQASAAANQDAPGTQTPDVVQMVGPVRMNQDVRSLPYIPNEGQMEERLFLHPLKGGPATSRTSAYPRFRSLLGKIFRPLPMMPGPLFTFEGIGDTCGCQPSDSEGDVGPNHYIEAINQSFQIYDKNGNTLAGPTTYNSFFAPLTGTPCGSNQNDGDPFVLYDHVADRWLITDFAFPAFPGTSFYECIAVSQTNDPVSGGWFFYALQVDPANPTFLGDYPKFALWNNPQPDGAYHMSVNLFSPSYEGVRVYALDRGAMLAGQQNPTVISFMIPVAAMGGTTFSGPIPASFRTGDSPPAGRDEFSLAIESPFAGGEVLTQVHGWYFHVDFVTPENSTFGVGPNHLSNVQMTVNAFVDAFTDTTYDLVPQQGTAQTLDTLGDRIMTPVVYQNRNGTESLWADSTVILNYPSGPTAVRWYQFDVTGGTFPATPAQQQDWTNGDDGLWRWMPSIAVDQNGNTVIGYSTSSTTIVPSIRYAGRLESDPPGDLAQGEGIMFAGVSAQTNGPRWGDYTRTDVDPSTGMDFYHINQYASGGIWHTRIGKFNFVGGPSPTPTATATATATPTATPISRSTPTPRPRPTPAPRP